MHVVRRYRYRSRSKTISEGAKVRNVIASGGTPCRPDNGFRDIEISCFKEIQPSSSRTTAYTVSFAISSFDEKERRLFLTYSHIQYRLDLWLMAYRAYVGGFRSVFNEEFVPSMHRHGIRGRFSFAGNFYNNDGDKRWKSEDSFFLFFENRKYCVLEILWQSCWLIDIRLSFEFFKVEIFFSR